MSTVSRTDQAKAKIDEYIHEQDNTPAEPPKHKPPTDEPVWPAPLDEAAYHGIAGELVRTLEPHTEADPVAILLQFLTAFGNCVGRGPHYQVEGDQHDPQLYIVLVGESSKARKGTSWSRARQLLSMIDEIWSKERIVSGLSSAEGLLHAVRDPGPDDACNLDRRLMVIEPEHARVLRVAARDGNTLSATIREAWDKGTLTTLTRNNPITASDTHISIIGHITADELRRYMDRTECGNGYANRYLYLCVRRARCLPDGGGDVNFNDIARRLAIALGKARQVGRIRMDEKARTIWHKVYPELSEGMPGMLGAVTARAEAQVIRLSVIYALLDEMDIITTDHLRAALALWQYAEESARYVWGSTLGDPVADDLLRALRNAGTAGMTRTDISNTFKRNRSSEQISRGLDLLARQERIECKRIETGGRPSESWIIKG